MTITFIFVFRLRFHYKFRRWENSYLQLTLFLMLCSTLFAIKNVQVFTKDRVILRRYNNLVMDVRGFTRCIYLYILYPYSPLSARNFSKSNTSSIQPQNLINQINCRLYQIPFICWRILHDCQKSSLLSYPAL